VSTSRPPRRRVAGERARVRRPSPRDGAAAEAPAAAGPDLEAPAVRDHRGPATVDQDLVDERGVEERGVDQQQEPERESAARPGWFLVVVAALLVLLVAGLATVAVLLYRVREADGVDRARREAVAAARSHAQVVLSYDHRRLDRDFARAERVLTGRFKREYARTTGTVVRPSAEQYDVVVAAQVVSASVVRADADEVVTLLYVNQTTTSTRLEGPEVDLNRVRMTLVERDGRWLVSALDAL